MESAKECLLGKTLSQMREACVALRLPAFVGSQLSEWIYRHRAKDFDEMKNISKKNRELLSQHFSIGRADALQSLHSVDGTSKYLFPTLDGNFVETVYIPDGDRATLCVSCQVGCKMGCAFCMTGRQGFVSSLCATDILNQIFSVPGSERLTNIVFMGQGEPFDNLDPVLQSIEVLTSEWGWNWSPKRITVSSVGVRKGLQRFLNESRCSLAISLHHPIPEERAKIMPAERAFSIVDVVEGLKQCPSFRRGTVGQDVRNEDESRQRRISFEYILFDGLNDQRQHADALIRLLRPLDCRVNLIRFHTIPDSPFKGVSEQKMTDFRNYLTSHGLFTTIRASRGEDIMAACGLLSTKEQSENKGKAHPEKDV